MQLWSRLGQHSLTALTILVACGLLAGFGALITPTPTTPTLNEPGAAPLVVEVIEVQRESGYGVARHFIGRVEPRQSAAVGFELAGKVVTIEVDEGDRLEPGDVIATLDTARLATRRKELVATRDEAAAQLELARSRRERVRQALARDAVSAQDWDDADRTFASRQAAVARTEAALATLDVELEKSTLSSPFATVVATRHVDRGQVLEAGRPVVHLLERMRPDLRLAVAGGSIQSVAVGSEHEVQVGEQTFAGRVRSVLPTRDQSSRGIDVLLTLDAELGTDLRAGDLGRVTVGRRVEQRGFWVPLEALTEGRRGLWAFYTVDAGVVRRVDAEILHEAADRAFVRAALSDGSPIVKNGLHRITAGQQVEIARVARAQ